MLLVDTNVLVDVLKDDPQWAAWSTGQMRAQARLHQLAINPVIYAEIPLSFSTLEALDRAVTTLDLQLRDIPRPALFLAARAYAQHRQRSGHKAQLLPVFFIGTHAAVEGWPLLTRDAGRFRTYFPSLEVLSPVQRSHGSLEMGPEDRVCAASLAQLRDDIQQGLDSGPTGPLDAEAIKRRGRERLAAAKKR